MNPFAFLALVILATGCASAPTQQELAGLYYGIPPKHAEEAYYRVVKPTLLDPNSIQTRNIHPPRKFWLKRGGTTSAFWLICGEVNAKNRFGAYTGFKPTLVWAKDGLGGIVETYPGSLGCIVGTHKQDIDPCGYYRHTPALLKCN